MRETLVLLPLWLIAALWHIQLGALPPWLHADLGLLMGLCAMAFLRRETGLIFLFALGLQADLLGSERLGLLTAGYLMSGGVLLSIERELAPAGRYFAALAAIAGSVVAHGMYFVLSTSLSAGGFGWSAGGAKWLSLCAAAAIWAGPVAWLLHKVWSWTGLLSPEAQGARASRTTRHQHRKMRARRA